MIAKTDICPSLNACENPAAFHKRGGAAFPVTATAARNPGI
jgi:hypothetical protein